MRALLVLAVLARTAAADDDADALTAQGETLARAGEFTRAIELFKRADAIHPSAHHACLIGLAYTRRELWSEAEIFFDRCKQGATAADPLPDWFSDASTQHDQKLHAANIAEVEIRVVPETARATLSISSFPRDETFGPRKLHVPGNAPYDLTVSAPGYWPAHHSLAPVAGTSTVVTIELEPKVKRPPSRAAWFWIGAAVLAAGGGVAHAFAVHDDHQLQAANDANDLAAWNARDPTFSRDRVLAIGCYSAAVVAATIGVVLHVRHETWVAPRIVAGGGTMMLGLEVHR